MNPQGGTGLGRWKLLAVILLSFSLSLVARAQPSPLTLRSHWPGYPSTRGFGVALSGDYAYAVAVGSAGFYVLNVSAPVRPEFVSYLDLGVPISSATPAIEVIGSLAYAAAAIESPQGGAVWLGVIDVRDPRNPLLIGSCAHPVNDGVVLMQLRVLGTNVFLAGGRTGLHVFDVSNPTQPMRVGGYKQAAALNYGVDVAGQYAYASYCTFTPDSSSGGVDVLDVSVPSQPRLVGSCCLADGTGYIIQVQLAGNYLYAANVQTVPGEFDQLHVVDIRDPANPVRVGGCSTPSKASLDSILVRERYAYVLHHSGNAFDVLDISDAVQPVHVGTYETPRGGLSFSVAGGLLCSGQLGSIEMIDVSTPRQMVHLAYHGFPTVSQVCVEGQYAFTFGGVELRVINTTDPLKPQLVGKYQAPAGTHGGAIDALGVSGTRGYMIGWVGHEPPTPSLAYLQTLDLTDPANPILLGTWEMSSGDSDGLGPGLALAGNYAFTSQSYWDDLAGDVRCRFLVFDVSDPANLRIVGTYAFGARFWPAKIEVRDSYAYVLGDGNGLAVLDISQPSNPTFVGQGEQLNWVQPSQDWAVTGRYAYVADYRSLRVIDLSNPALPVQVGLFQPENTDIAIGGVQVADRHAIVSGRKGESPNSRGYLAVLDVADPTRPTLVTEYETKGESAPDIELVGNRLYVANDDWGLAIYDFVPPNVTPRLRLNPPVLFGGVLVLTWEGGAGIKLQKTTSLSTPNWEDVSNTEGRSLVALPPSGTAAFFRLRQ